MRHRISITLEQDTVLGIMDLLRDPRFGNRSQIVEFALKKFFDENRRA
jgi:hypothetical protein